MAIFSGKINTGEARRWIKRITKSAFKNDVDVPQERAVERRKQFVE